MTEVIKKLEALQQIVKNIFNPDPDAIEQDIQPLVNTLASLISHNFAKSATENCPNLNPKQIEFLTDMNVVLLDAKEKGQERVSFELVITG